MKHAIDPKVDCVFKAILGRPSHRQLLCHFINAMLQEVLPQPVVNVHILNPLNLQDYLTDKLSIVDVKASDATGQQFQIEIQLRHHAGLTERIAYGWSDLYSRQLEEGQSYKHLQPVYAIWLLNQRLPVPPIPAEAVAVPPIPAHAPAESSPLPPPDPIRYYQLCDQQQRPLSNRIGGVWLCELNRLCFSDDEVANERQRWLRFFQQGRDLDADQLPRWMNTMEMQQAMHTLKTFSEKQQAYHIYQSRINARRLELTLQEERDEMEAARDEMEAARDEMEAARNEMEQAMLQAQQREQLAQQREQQAQQREQQAQQREQLAQAEREQAQAELAKALAELERLKPRH